MIRKLSAVLVTGAVLFWGHALPAGAQEISVESPVAVDSLDPTDEMILQQAFQEVIAESADVRREAAAAQKSCKKIKNKKKRKKCMKKSEEPERVERVVTSEYQAPAIGSGTGVCLRPTNSCGDIPVGLDEKYVKIEITDATGLPVFFGFGQDTDPEALGTETSYGEFCGSTGDEPIEIQPGYTIVVFPWLVGGCPGVASMGTITATLSNLP